MNSLKRKLEYHYKRFNASQLFPDPLVYPHRFTSEEDIEISAFIASIFAYGNMTQILNSLDRIHELIGDKPKQFFENLEIEKHNDFFENFKHRFYTGKDIRTLFIIIEHIIKDYESIKHLFLLYYFDQDKNVKNSLSFFSKNLMELAGRFCNITGGIKFMFPNPFNGSACKRMNLFLRWMVRKDELDFGLWKAVRKDQLVMPVDTHVAKISKELKLTTRKIVTWQMAEEITENLKLFDNKDPVKYDFAICHIGIRKLKF